jgi:hypothetical protein
MEHLHATRPPWKECPHEVGDDVRVEFHQRGAARVHGHGFWRVGVDLPEAFRFFARSEPELDARIAGHGAHDWSNHREVHGRARVKEDAPALRSAIQPRVEVAESLEGARGKALHTGDPAAAGASALARGRTRER